MATLRRCAKELGCDPAYLLRLIDWGVISRPATGDYSIEQAAIEWLTHLRQSADLREKRRAKVEAKAGAKSRTDEARAAVLDEKTRQAAARADGASKLAKARVKTITATGKARARLAAAKADRVELKLVEACTDAIEAAHFSTELAASLDYAKRYLKRHGVKVGPRTVAAKLLEGLSEKLREPLLMQRFLPGTRRRPASASEASEGGEHGNA